MMVGDHGTEFTSNAILAWTAQRKVAWHDIAPGRPTQNAFVECYNGRTRDELLRDAVFQPRPCPPDARRLGCRLQHATAALRPLATRLLPLTPSTWPQQADSAHAA